MKRNNQLDVLKYIACFFVIMIHWDIPLTLERIVQPLLTTAVPIFFMIEIIYKVINLVSDYGLLADFLTWIGPILVLFISTLLAHILSCCKVKIKTLKK